MGKSILLDLLFLGNLLINFLHLPIDGLDQVHGSLLVLSLLGTVGDHGVFEFQTLAGATRVSAFGDLSGAL
jgi:hypothetical protein